MFTTTIKDSVLSFVTTLHVVQYTSSILSSEPGIICQFSIIFPLYIFSLTDSVKLLFILWDIGHTESASCPIIINDRVLSFKKPQLSAAFHYVGFESIGDVCDCWLTIENH